MTFRLLFLLVALAAQLTVHADDIQRGKATFYGYRADGRRTASGELHRKDSLVCAHRTHPFGTLLRVYCPSTDKEVVVKVNDRGPFSRGRIIDLSNAAARALGILRHGVATIEISVVGTAPIKPAPKRAGTQHKKRPAAKAKPKATPAKKPQAKTTQTAKPQAKATPAKKPQVKTTQTKTVKK